MISTIGDLSYAGACGMESFRDRCTFLMEVGSGVVYGYAVFMEWDVASRWMGGEVDLGWKKMREPG